MGGPFYSFTPFTNKIPPRTKVSLRNTAKPANQGSDLISPKHTSRSFTLLEPFVVVASIEGETNLNKTSTMRMFQIRDDERELVTRR